MREHVKDLQGKDCIEPVQSEWASPVVLVSKSDGTLHFCVDYRRLNKLTVKDASCYRARTTVSTAP